MRFRFVAHPGIFTFATRIAQYGNWPTHAEFDLGDGHYISAMFKDGVQMRKYNYDNGVFLREEFVEIEASAEQEIKFRNFLISQIGKPYDIWAIASFVFADWFNHCREWDFDDSWFCSEYLAAGLAVSGILSDQLSVKATHISVRDLMILVSSRVKVD
jgi:uncharacterized protein YycO